MNNQNIKLHEHQKSILAKLTNSPTLRFNELLIEHLESEHMNYHLKKLISLQLVISIDGDYQLTDKGKDYSNMMDDEIEFIEKQPKTSVLLHAVRKNHHGEVEHLLSKRLRHPYFGKIGRLTGKVQFGETLEQAARRELYEETGLEANTVVLEQIYHKMRRNPDGEYVQDNIFYRFFIKDTFGKFIDKTQHQENLWLSKTELHSGGYDLFDDLTLTDRYAANKLKFVEDVSEVKGY